MISRRRLIASGMAIPMVAGSLSAQTPESSAVLMTDPTLRMLSLSPNGETLLALNGDDTILFLSANDQAEISRCEPLPEVGAMLVESIRWSPDSSKIAFCLDAWRRSIDSDIFVAEVETGVLTNLTPEGSDDEADSLFTDPNVTIDTNPVWREDSTLIFVRNTDLQAKSTTLMTMSYPDGEPEAWTDLDVMWLTGPSFLTADGSLIVLGSEDGVEISLLTVTADGDVQRDSDPFWQSAMILDATDTHAIVADARMSATVIVPLQDTGAAMTFAERFGAVDPAFLRALPAFGPEPDSIVAVLGPDNDVMIARGDEIQTLGSLDVEAASILPTCHWKANKVLIAGGATSWLLYTEASA